MSNHSIRPIESALTDATTQGLREPGSDGNEGTIFISQSCSITGTSSSRFLELYPELSLGVGILPLSKEAVGAFYSPSRLYFMMEEIN